MLSASAQPSLQCRDALKATLKVIVSPNLLFERISWLVKRKALIGLEPVLAEVVPVERIQTCHGYLSISLSLSKILPQSV